MYALLLPLLFALDPGKAHRAAMTALAPLEHSRVLRALVARVLAVRDPRLAVTTMGLTFPTPVGLAGGFDKDAERARALAALGFGHLELGTVTAEPQSANPEPNLFRLPADRALINRLGFPNRGAHEVAATIARKKGGIGVPIGVSIGKSRRVALEPSEGVLADYRASFEAVRDVADFVVINVSSPNTKDLRAMQAAEAARSLFDTLVATRGRRPGGTRSTPPLLVKIAPDLEDASIDAICDAAMDAGLEGVVATNTTISRARLSTPLEVVEACGAGGLSGPPLFARAVSVVERVRARVGSRACVIGVGGIRDAATAHQMLSSGADLVQLYTGFVYGGPLLPRRIARGLLARVGADSARPLDERV
jgi:dihydroorotate dehydrogenase